MTLSKMAMVLLADLVVEGLGLGLGRTMDDQVSLREFSLALIASFVEAQYALPPSRPSRP